jgi:hypothetical protein
MIPDAAICRHLKTREWCAGNGLGKSRHPSESSHLLALLAASSDGWTPPR